jgi:hypothetical protein
MPENNGAAPLELAEGFNPFSDDAQQVQTQQRVEEAPTQQVQEPTQSAPVETQNTSSQEASPEIAQVQEQGQSAFDSNQFLKEKFGFDNVEQAEQEFKKIKESKDSEFNFENETSRNLFNAIKEGKLDEIYDVLSQQKRLEKLTNSEINGNLAVDIIRTNLQNKYKDLTSDEVDLLFYQNYNFPQRPEKSFEDTDEDYEQKLNGWQNEIDFIERRMIIDAKVIKPELEKLKSEIKLPDVYGFEKQEAQSREAFEMATQARQVYERTLESDFKNFNGFEVTVKDEDVEVPVSFNISEDEKLDLKNRLSDFDSDAYYENRWFKQDGTPNVKQAMQDIYLLENWDKISKKLVNEAASQVKLAYIKNSGNVTINPKTPQGTPQPNPNAQLDDLAMWAFRS